MTSRTGQWGRRMSLEVGPGCRVNDSRLAAFGRPITNGEVYFVFFFPGGVVFVVVRLHLCVSLHLSHRPSPSALISTCSPSPALSFGLLCCIFSLRAPALFTSISPFCCNQLHHDPLRKQIYRFVHSPAAISSFGHQWLLSSSIWLSSIDRSLSLSLPPSCIPILLSTCLPRLECMAS